jgi:hypothetical protein
MAGGMPIGHFCFSWQIRAQNANAVTKTEQEG